ncbi:hypothetical protein CRG98_030995 [Punica granatum]|uniref:Uncharacterized protein n=1 Tax=Punica granatum TaxID=22663 RepID=A0A2I0IYS5_PUNGR|nr:hypothetical protein CRG98_030995 [Punica granatum]
MRDPQPVRNPTQLALREKATQIDRCCLDKSDCQSGLPVDSTAPTWVCSFQGAESTSQTHFFDFPRLFPHPGARLELKSRRPCWLGKPKEPLSLTLREVAESPSWLPRAMDDLLSPTHVVS